jgi:undecaprenyl-diphosphatase
LDTFLFQKLNNLAGNPIFDSIFVFAADKLGYVTVAAFVVLWLIGKRKKIFTNSLLYLPFASALISRFAITELIRFFYKRPRPFEVLEVNQLIEHSAGRSFPSGHAAFFFALATGIYLFNKKTGVWFLVAAGLIAFSRVYAGIHYPLDVVVGAGIGIGTAVFFDRLVHSDKPSRNKRAPVLIADSRPLQKGQV